MIGLEQGMNFIRRNAEEIVTASFLITAAGCGTVAVNGFVEQQHIETQIQHTADAKNKAILESNHDTASAEIFLGTLGAILISFPATGEIISLRDKHRTGKRDSFYRTHFSEKE